VKFFGRRRRRSIGVWGVALGAFLLVGCYLVFDVLDLDGSDLQHRLFNNAIAPQGAWAETERALHQSLAAPGAHRPDAAFIRSLPVSRSRGTLLHMTSAPISSQVRRIRPRAHAGRGSLDRPASSDDLARTLAHAALDSCSFPNRSVSLRVGEPGGATARTPQAEMIRKERRAVRVCRMGRE
jgi:hypothetical protein